MNKERKEGEEILLMSRERVQRSIKRMAYQIAEENKDDSDILLIGIKERGYITANLLGKELSGLTGGEVDIRQFIPDTENKALFEDAGSNYIILVDDVIFSGRTILEAMQEILKRMQPQTIRTAVLVDRGHRKVPVEAAFLGLELPTKLNEHVQVQTQSDTVKKVVLNHSSL